MKKYVVIIITILFLSSCNKPVKITEDVLKINSSNFEYGEIVKLSDILSNKDIVYEDFDMDTTNIGENKIYIKYVKDDIAYKEEIVYTVSDTTPPLLWLAGTISVPIDYSGDVLDKIICADNYDVKPKCSIIGDYDFSTEGTFPLKIEATDSHGNSSSDEFTLKVYEPKPKDNTETPKEEKIITKIEDVIAKHKNENTMIGIDVSRWQGEIDWEKVKNSGVEFAIIRLGGQTGFNKDDYYIDSQFENNIQGALANDIKVGLYFYSYAISASDGKKQAKFIIDNIKKYNVEMPIAYDWENYSHWNELEISLFDLRNAAYSFEKYLEKHGYTPIHYGSKNYLSAFWDPIIYDTWLAHYVDKTTYDGNYKMWQICDNGQVDGINADVDIDIYYK